MKMLLASILLSLSLSSCTILHEINTSPAHSGSLHKKFSGMRIGIMDISAGYYSTSEQRFALNEATSCLYKLGAEVIERDKIIDLLEEIHFQMTGATDQDTSVQVGKLLNIRYVFIGHYTNPLSDNAGWAPFYITFTGRIIDVETGSTVASGSARSGGWSVELALKRSIESFFKSL